MARGPLKWAIYIISAGLIVFGGLFIIASYAVITRLPVGMLFIIHAVLLIYFSREKKPIEIKQTVDISGPLKIKAIRCPNCSANLDAQKMEVIAGRPFMTCHYCGNKFEITEEPLW